MVFSTGLGANPYGFAPLPNEASETDDGSAKALKNGIKFGKTSRGYIDGVCMMEVKSNNIKLHGDKLLIDGTSFIASKFCIPPIGFTYSWQGGWFVLKKKVGMHFTTVLRVETSSGYLFYDNKLVVLGNGGTYEMKDFDLQDPSIKVKFIKSGGTKDFRFSVWRKIGGKMWQVGFSSDTKKYYLINGKIKTDLSEIDLAKLPNKSNLPKLKISQHGKLKSVSYNTNRMFYDIEVKWSGGYRKKENIVGWVLYHDKLVCWPRNGSSTKTIWTA